MSDLVELLAALDELNYAFVTPTPATHARVTRSRRIGDTLRDLLGWSLPVPIDRVPRRILDALEAAGELAREDDRVRSRVRVSSCGGGLFVHSAYPTEDRDSVFFGPDSYRFVRFILEKTSGSASPRHLVDFGCGAGVGGIALSRTRTPRRLTLIDSNEKALRYAAANASFAHVEPALMLGDDLSMLDGETPDLIIANPPYMLDTRGPTYRDGGDLLGAQLSLDWAREAVARLRFGGRLLLYSGSAIVDGEDRLRTHLAADAERLGCTFSYEEIDPDVFGEQLDEPAYAGVERIAAVGAVLTRTA